MLTPQKSKIFKHVISNYSIPKIKRESIDGKRMYISPSGRALHSVTTILSGSKEKKKIITEWKIRVGEDKAKEISRRATSSGKGTHDALEKLLENNPLPSMVINPNSITHYSNIKKKLVEHVDNVRHIEQMLFSENMGAAGTADLIAEFDGTLSIIDFKTAAKYKKREWIGDYFEQAAAYAEMYGELTGNVIDNLVIIISHGHGVNCYAANRQDYINGFIDKCNSYIASFNADIQHLRSDGDQKISA